jgi:hypothetical protein
VKEFITGEGQNRDATGSIWAIVSRTGGMKRHFDSLVVGFNSW